MSAANVKPGWYPDDRGVERWWDGDGWTDDVRDSNDVAPPAPPKRGWNAGDYLTYGILASVIASGLLAAGLDNRNDALTVVGAVCASFGSIVLMIGIIAKGVAVGMETRDDRRLMDEN